MKTYNVAVVGCGNISGQYLKELTKNSPNLRIVAVCDQNEEKAETTREAFQIEKRLTFGEITVDPSIDVVLILTPPQSHFELAKRAIQAKKHVYLEKPLSQEYRQGKELLRLAKKNGILLGCAPDTFMGSGIQTCRKLIENGEIGDLLGASAFMTRHGPEDWHPNPAFFYQTGGGPLYDMGPYYLTALIALLGRVDSVSGMCAPIIPERKIEFGANAGKSVRSEIPTHIHGLLRFSKGYVGSILTTFDVWGSRLPHIEIHGTRGTISANHPNLFSGAVFLKRFSEDNFQEVPLIENCFSSRADGIRDMVNALARGSKNFSAHGQRALHALEIMEAIQKSDREHREISLESDPEYSAFL